jgi:type IV pilus assembly protein PilB
VAFLRGARLDAALPFPMDPDAVRRVPEALALRYDVLGVGGDENSLAIVVPDPSDSEPLDKLRFATGLRVHAFAAPREVIRRGLATAYGVGAVTRDGRLDDSPAVALWDTTQGRAVEARASDIHIEPTPSGGRIRQRVDGLLTDAADVPSELFDRLVVRVKLLAGMDITDRRKPQDGRLRIVAAGREIDARVASLPTLGGESLVVRIVDAAATLPPLDSLGMSSATQATFRAALEGMHGCILVCGPTGSGKTTTLYSALVDRRDSRRRICSIEDPIELELPGVAQVEINPRAGLSFEAAIRAVVRQDPDMVMIGEIRDSETGRAVASASLAGHVLLSTLHAADAIGAIDRLAELGVNRRTVANAVRCIVAQRLVRTCCPCRRLSEMTCASCAGTGYRGRTGVFEIVLMDETLREAVAAGVSAYRLRNLVQERTSTSLMSELRRLVSDQTTDEAEAKRIFGAMWA